MRGCADDSFNKGSLNSGRFHFNQGRDLLSNSSVGKKERERERKKTPSPSITLINEVLLNVYNKLSKVINESLSLRMDLSFYVPQKKLQLAIMQW